MNDLPKEITIEGQPFWLNVERFGKQNEIVLTYEYTPQRDDSFLLSAYGIDLQCACSKMRQLLKQEQIL